MGAILYCFIGTVFIIVPVVEGLSLVGALVTGALLNVPVLEGQLFLGLSLVGAITSPPGAGVVVFGDLRGAGYLMHLRFLILLGLSPGRLLGHSIHQPSFFEQQPFQPSFLDFDTA
jgi:hypothetical protein